MAGTFDRVEQSTGYPPFRRRTRSPPPPAAPRGPADGPTRRLPRASSVVTAARGPIVLGKPPPLASSFAGLPPRRRRRPRRGGLGRVIGRVDPDALPAERDSSPPDAAPPTDLCPPACPHDADDDKFLRRESDLTRNQKPKALVRKGKD